MFQRGSGLSLPLDLLLVENRLGSELGVCVRRDLFFSVARDDDASFQTEEEEIVLMYLLLIHSLRRQGICLEGDLWE